MAVQKNKQNNNSFIFPILQMKAEISLNIDDGG